MVKRIYLALSVLWLVACSLYALLPHLAGNYYTLEVCDPVSCFCTPTAEHAAQSPGEFACRHPSELRSGAEHLIICSPASYGNGCHRMELRRIRK
jgi:hypothetical protein